MKYSLLLFFCFSSIAIAAQPEFYWKDGVIKFEPFKIQTGTTPGVDLPTEMQVNISTSGMKFENADDFRRCFNDKSHLENKIVELQKEFDGRSFLPIAQLRLRRQNLDWLKSYYQSLP